MGAQLPVSHEVLLSAIPMCIRKVRVRLGAKPHKSLNNYAAISPFSYIVKNKDVQGHPINLRIYFVFLFLA